MHVYLQSGGNGFLGGGGGGWGGGGSDRLHGENILLTL